MTQPDNGWRNPVKVFTVVFDLLCFALYQNNCSPPARDIERSWERSGLKPWPLMLISANIFYR